MTVRSISRIAVPSLLLVGACGAALFFGFTQPRRESPAETNTVTAAPVVSPPASGSRDAAPAVLAMAQTEANALATIVAAPPRPADTRESAPAFDIARIERNGEAVIAGRAAPGATVELLRDGERHDQAIADQSGEFVMAPPRLPPGNYTLTLRSKLPDGTLATSRQEVAVALDPVESSPAALQTHAELPFNVPDTGVTNRLRQHFALSRPPQTAAPAKLPDGGSTSASTSALAGPRIATVSRGDTLWRISRATYGVGTRYAVVYKANRDHIRDPNRIYPGQVFILPMKPR